MSTAHWASIVDTVSITDKVLILTKGYRLHHQNESIAKKYMNRFAIDEDDQFEIHVKDYTDKGTIGKEEIYNVAEEVMLKAQQGSVDLTL